MKKQFYIVDTTYKTHKWYFEGFGGEWHKVDNGWQPPTYYNSLEEVEAKIEELFKDKDSYLTELEVKTIYRAK